ncbi:uncharacterized protein LOC110711273 [Chenopodium quinoa]|uniref:uncharacterized protein LOC110711273 n=1 Tax=Chenopodium quinoa TaxID=63459 RepID=UPI000B770A0A|nr:uncharacterized protein LOC110711273 [Chenopodium quinoa]
MGEAHRVTFKELGTPGAYKYESGIAPLLIPDGDFEIKPATVILIERKQYGGTTSENPLNHLKDFEKYCNTIMVDGVAQEYIRLKLFPFSLIVRALEWLDKEVKPRSFRTWDEVTKSFLSRFYPPKKTAEASALIQSFKQLPRENLYEAWERYKDYQRECPHHGIPTYQVIQIFYGGLSSQGRSSLDAGAGGPIMNKTEEEVVDVIDDVVMNYMDWHDVERESTSTSGSIDQSNVVNNLSTLVSELVKENDYNVSNCPNVPCDRYDGYENVHVNCVDNNDFGPRFNARKNVRNRNYHNHGSYDNYNQNSGYGYGNHNQNSGQNHGKGNWSNQIRGDFQNDVQRGTPPQITPTTQSQGDDFYAQQSQLNKLENFMMAQSEKLNEFTLSCNKMFEVIFTHGKMLENQINELAIPLIDCASPLSLPSQEVDSREPMCAMTTRSDKVLKESVPRKSKESEKENDSSEGNKHEEPRKMSEDSNDKPKEKERNKYELYKTRLPYPQNHNRYKLDEQFGKFIEMLKQLHLTLPFTDVVEQMSSNYAKFLNEILSGKRDCNMVELKLKLGELLPSNMTLQLADRSIKFPKGRVEDVPLKIGEFTIPVDFIVLEIAEDDQILIILGRPFLATSGALIDVKGLRITFRVGKNEESFELKPMHESLSFMKGIMCVNSPHPIDNVCMIDSSNNDVLENCDDVLLSCDCKNVNEKKTKLPKLMDEEEIDIPHWFELYPQEEDDDPKSGDGVKPFTKKNNAKKRARASRKKRKRMRLWKEKLAFEELLNDVSSSNNEKLLEVEEKFALSATLKKVFFDPP